MRQFTPPIPGRASVPLACALVVLISAALAPAALGLEPAADVYQFDEVALGVDADSIIDRRADRSFVATSSSDSGSSLLSAIPAGALAGLTLTGLATGLGLFLIRPRRRSEPR